MSKIIVREIESPSGAINFVGGLTIADSGSISFPGRIVQMKHVTYKTRTSWQNATSNTGSVSSNVPGMQVDLQCKFASSKVVIEARILGDVHHNTVFRYTVNGSHITTAAYDSYNDDAGANRWSGITGAPYDGANNNNSTPADIFFMVFYKPGNTNNNTYRIVSREGNTAQSTNYINRTGGSNGQNSYECGVSSMIIYEIEE